MILRDTADLNMGRGAYDTTSNTLRFGQLPIASTTFNLEGTFYVIIPLPIIPFSLYDTYTSALAAHVIVGTPCISGFFVFPCGYG